jgi:hypothetical protein
LGDVFQHATKMFAGYEVEALETATHEVAVAGVAWVVAK